MAASRPESKSGTIARESTTHAPPPRPCKKRAATKMAMLGDSAAIADATSATIAPPMSSRRRPMTSEIGPTINCPKAMPTKKPDKVSCTTESGALKSAPTAGKVGRYISVAKGAVADNSANARSKETAIYASRLTNITTPIIQATTAQTVKTSPEPATESHGAAVTSPSMIHVLRAENGM